MIFGFNIICGIPDELAVDILRKLNLQVGQYTFDTPVNNPIRSIGINYAGYHFLRINVNAGVLVSGKETLDIEFVKEPDFKVLDERFRDSLYEIVGNDIANKLPSFRNWTLWIMRYAMDIKVDHINETMKLFGKTGIPAANLNSSNAIGMIKPFETFTAKTAKLEIYPKSELIKLGRIDYKLPVTPRDDSDTIRFYFQHKRSMMGYVKRLLTKFEIDLWSPESFLHPLVVTGAFTTEYLNTIGGGDFYKYETAVELIENTVSNAQNRRMLIEFLNTGIGDKKTIKLLQECGINRALINPDMKFDRIANPFNEIVKKCDNYINFG
jgi:hypothetical protein